MNENKEHMSFYLVLPSTSSNFRKSCGTVYFILPKEIHLDEERHWEELFCPKHDSVSISENLWYETQESKMK